MEKIEKYVEEVGTLSAAAIDTESVVFDWSADYGTSWEMVIPRPGTVDECLAMLEDYSVAFEDVDVELVTDILAEKELLNTIISDTVIDLHPEDPSERPEEFRTTVVERFEAEQFSVHDSDDLLNKVFIWDETGAFLRSDADLDDMFSSAYLAELQDYLRCYLDENYPENFCPMMNYYYPLPYYSGDASEDQSNLSGCVLAYLVQEEKYVMALSACGMDLTWEICNAYITLGYLPPYWACKSLPRMGYVEDWQLKVLVAARRTVEIIRNSAEHAHRRISTEIIESITALEDRDAR